MRCLIGQTVLTNGGWRVRTFRRFRWSVFVVGVSVLLLLILWISPSLWHWQGKNKCQSNLKLIGEGVYTYHAHFGAFPAGTVPHHHLPPEKRLSWLVEVTPFFEGDNPFSRIDKTKGWDSPDNIAACNAIVPSLFVCPSSPIQSIQGTGVTNYVGIAGLGQNAALLPKDDQNAGVFGNDRQVKLSDIKDGTSNTMMVIETSLDVGPWCAGGRPTVRGLDSSLQPYIGKGCQFGGLHSNGCMVLFADGSVRFLKESINSQVFESLSTIAGGEGVR